MTDDDRLMYAKGHLQRAGAHLAFPSKASVKACLDDLDAARKLISGLTLEEPKPDPSRVRPARVRPLPHRHDQDAKS